MPLNAWQVGCDWPEARGLSELIDALPARGMRVVVIADMQVGGTLPEVLFERCAQAETLAMFGMELEGGVPAGIGRLTKARRINLSKNRLCGTLPESIGQCLALEQLVLDHNQLSGTVPDSIGQCVALHELRLDQTQLSSAAGHAAPAAALHESSLK